MSEKLKKCPFCGWEAEVRQYTSTLYFAQCKRCKATSNAFETEEEAAGAWNERYNLLSRIREGVKSWLKSWLKSWMES
ncbi:MAG: Lar family restriction alleviation protein [Synergistaceae bacterium]|nr:Lar family restriction alleviation protein [Synergistaceae bacterium]